MSRAKATTQRWPPVAISVPLKFQRQGIKYDDLTEAVRKGVLK